MHRGDPITRLSGRTLYYDRRTSSTSVMVPCRRTIHGVISPTVRHAAPHNTSTVLLLRSFTMTPQYITFDIRVFQCSA